MNDPFETLREPTSPVAPDPIFARALRARLERALLDDPEDRMTTTEPRIAAAETLPLHALTPYLALTDARTAVDFYVSAFGARRRGDPIVMPDGRIGHVEVALGDSVLMMADEYPEIGLVAPVNRGGPTQSLRLEVPDPDAVVDRAVGLGATLERPVADSPYGRGGVVIDPSGHRWMVSREAPAGHRPGEVVYASLWTRDVVRAERFYADVLGWATAPGSGEQGRLVTNAGFRLGLFGGQPRPTTMACYAVADVDTAVALVRAAGGTAGDPIEKPYGRVTDCIDDQDIPFALLSGAPSTGGQEDVPHTEALAHLTLRIPDGVRARAFYGTVLGWGFAPGRVADGWNVRIGDADTRPRTLVWGGHPEATVVPSFLVADVATAVRAVRAAGGTSTEPEQRRYGQAADCTDDQGGEFQLVQQS